MVKFTLLIFIFLNTILYGAYISVDDKKSKLEILSSSEIYEDRTKSLSIQEIQKKSKEFKSNIKSRISFGYSPDFDVWIKITLQNNTNKNIRKIIEYANPLTTHLAFFDPSTNSSYKDGLFQINPQRKAVNPYFYIELKPFETKTYYLKASSTITTMIVKLNLWDNEEFFNQELKHQSILQLFFGAMLVLAIYNFFVYLFTKDLSYLFYVLYIVGISLHQSIYVGVGSSYLYSQDITINILLYASLLVAFPAVSLGLFTKYFINTYQYPKVNMLLNMLLVLVILNTVFFCIYPTNQYRNLLPSLFLLFLMGITIYAFIKGNKQALLILFGWIIFTSSGVFMFLSSAGILNIFSKFPYYIEVGLMVEAIIFSIALVDKINHLQYEKNAMNQALIKQKETEKERLEIEVKRKTKELQVAVHKQTTLLKELNHRVKNNMQTIISLVQLQADEIDDEKIVDVFMTIQNRISAMIHLHELLYKQSDITHINTHEYFDILVDDLQLSYELDVDITYDVPLNLEVEPAISCGLILNELIINSFKYAFKSMEKPSIHIELYKKDTTYHFNISDNGRGYDETKTKTSFGLVLVATLVEDYLKGEITTTTKNGVLNKIVWSEDE